MASKEDTWDIVVVQTRRQRVVFEEPVMANEAKKLYLRGQYYDIIEDEEISIDEIVEVT
jgi:hypothetical protein